MMQVMNSKLNRVMNETTEAEKIRLFYELGKHLVKTGKDEKDPDMQNLFNDISAVIQDIENL